MAGNSICNESDISIGEMKAFRVNGERILIYHLEDGFYATQGLCTHFWGPLEKGKIIEGDKVRCPIHHALFDIRTGEKRVEAGKANENGDVEQRHHRFKRAVEQSLLLRGRRDFTDRQEYKNFMKIWPCLTSE